ncbi:uncharacterized protein J3R85_002822 [Psidium guajava]|nr:uncharacterized protein J3R85_002822 [Psidium guajava]
MEQSLHPRSHRMPIWSRGQSRNSVENCLGVSGHGDGEVGEDVKPPSERIAMKVEDRRHGGRGQEVENKRAAAEGDGGVWIR